MKKSGTEITPWILDWKGPFGYRANELVKYQLDPAGPEDTAEVSDKKGLYCIVGDHPTYGDRSLLYIGRTKTTLKQRLYDHRDWLNEEWRAEIYFAEIIDDTLREAAEKLLIYAHSPAY